MRNTALRGTTPFTNERYAMLIPRDPPYGADTDRLRHAIGAVASFTTSGGDLELGLARHWFSSLGPSRDDLDRGADLIGDAENAQRDRRRGHSEIAERPAGVRRRGRGEIAAVAFRRHIERDLLGLAPDRHVARQRERERSARREGHRQPAGLRRHELRCRELADPQRVALDEV